MTTECEFSRGGGPIQKYIGTKSSTTWAYVGIRKKGCPICIIYNLKWDGVHQPEVQFGKSSFKTFLKIVDDLKLDLAKESRDEVKKYLKD